VTVSAAVFSCDDLTALTATVVDAWLRGADRDWSVPAGTLDWSCRATADHAVDTVLAPAFFLASRKQDGYPAGEPFTLGPDADAATLVEGLQTATRILLAVVQAAEPGATATIWRRPQLEVRPAADFLPRAGLELLLHAHDVCTGLGVPFSPPVDACDHLRRHTADWPFWDPEISGWSPLTLDGDPLTDLLRAAGRS
jgi:hypothetical protein